MKKSILFFAILLIASLSLNGQQNQFKLIGKTNSIPDKTMLYLDETKTNQRTDSTLIIDNHFVLEGKVDSFKEVFISAQFNDQFQYAPLYLEPNEMTFDASQSDFFNAKVTGSKLQAQADELRFLMAENTQKAMTANEKVNEIYDKNLDTTGVAQLKKERDELFQKEDSITIEFVRTHPDYRISVKCLTYLKHNLPKSEVKALYSNLSKEMQNTADGQSIKLWLEESIQLEIGGKAPNFELPNLQNKAVSLEEFEGKYVLLEFGASNCGPCRHENPNLLKAYKKYKDHGFDIISVWLDKRHENWSKTVEKDQMIWTSVCDLKGHAGDVPLIYNINSIPSNFLLNEKGVVVAKNLRGEKLQEFLAGLFENEVEPN